jgi:hypothetical protein
MKMDGVQQDRMLPVILSHHQDPQHRPRIVAAVPAKALHTPGAVIVAMATGIARPLLRETHLVRQQLMWQVLPRLPPIHAMMVVALQERHQPDLLVASNIL